MVTGTGQFELALEQLTRTLRREHQCEINELKATISRLEGERGRGQAPAPDPKGDESPAAPVLPRAVHFDREPEQRAKGGSSARPAPVPEDPGGGHERESTGGLPAYETTYSLTAQRGSVDSSGEPRWEHPGEAAAPAGPASRHSTLTKALTKSLKAQQTKRLSLSANRHQRTMEFSSNGCLRLVERVVRSNYFEAAFSGLIALNAVVMVWEAQMLGEGVATDLAGQPQQAAGATGVLADGPPPVFAALGTVFGVSFTIEIVLRLIGQRCDFIFDGWNWIDLAIVVSWFVGMMEDSIPINPQLIRLARLAKLVRMLRLVKRMQGFDSLYLMTTSLRGSISILGWTTCVLLLVLVLNALLLNRVLVEFYFLEASYPLSERKELFRYFGSFTTSLFSMFELTLANWPPISRLLYESVTGWFIVIALAHKLAIGVAVIGVINGVFMQETFKVAQQDDEIMMRRALQASRTHADKMRRLMETADQSGEGQLDLEEFRRMFEDPGIKAWLASMELNPGDVDALFQMMDDGDGTLTVDEVIKGVAKFKGVARNLDLHMMLREQRQLKRHVETHLPVELSV